MRTTNKYICSILAAQAVISCTTKPQETTLTRPNILFMMSDDHAVKAISAYGGELAQIAPTPNIDRIAEQGALFTRNYCSNSISGPSRAAVLTGKHSHKNGFMKNDNRKFDGTQPTIPNILQAEGYQTAVIGKWHLNSKPHGFDHYEILNDQGEYNNPDFITKDTTRQRMGYVSDIITDLTTEWLDQRDKEKPFFLVMNHKAPHRNWVPAARHYNAFDHIKFPMPSTYFDNYEGRDAAAHQEMNLYRDAYEGHDLKMVAGVGSDSLLYDRWPHVFMGRMTEAEKQEFFAAYRKKNDEFYAYKRSEKEIAAWKYQRYMQDYLATVKAVDESIGEILTYLEENNLAENTIVVYTADQGFYLGEHGWFDKRFMYEESYRMPLLIAHPKMKNKGKIISQLTQNIDFAPTFLEMCGIQAPKEMQGKSFLPLLLGNAEEVAWRDALYYHYYEYPGFHDVKKHRGVNTERYKLIHFFEENIWEMYDLKTDSTEINNIYGKAEYKIIQQELEHKLDSLTKAYDVPADLYSQK